MRHFIILFAVTGLALLGASAPAQVGAGSPGNMSASLLLLFGKHTNFTAKAHMRVTDKNGRETLSGPVQFAMLDGRSRIEMSLGQLTTAGVSAAALEGLKQMGMERIVNLTGPDQKKVFVLFPDLASALSMDLPPEEVAALARPPKMESKEEAKETVDGRTCVRSKVVITDDQGLKREATVWLAPDLQNFPVKLDAKEKDSTLVLTYSQVKLGKPDKKLFAVPPTYKQYADMQELITGVVAKTMGTAPK